MVAKERMGETRMAMRKMQTPTKCVHHWHCTDGLCICRKCGAKQKCVSYIDELDGHVLSGHFIPTHSVKRGQVARMETLAKRKSVL